VTKAAPLTEKDGVLLTDFVNKTDDPVFDDALKQALTIQLSQSPFLNIVSDRKIEETLRLMGQPLQRITPDLAREICIRTGSKATVLGSISSLGSQYVIGLSAVGCGNGDTLATEQEQAVGKKDVLKMLGRSAKDLRRKLGESLVTVEKAWRLAWWVPGVLHNRYAATPQKVSIKWSVGVRDSRTTRVRHVHVPKRHGISDGLGGNLLRGAAVLPKRSRVPHFAMFSRYLFSTGVALVTFRGIAKRAIKKVTDQPDEFLLLVEFHGRVSEPARAQVLQQTLLGQNQGPRDLLKRNVFRGAFHPEFVVAGLNRLIGLLPEPQAKVVVNLVAAIVKFVAGEFVIRLGPWTAL
jgi:hypothetical protein